MSSLAMEHFSPQGRLRRRLAPGLVAERVRLLRSRGWRVAVVRPSEWEGLRGEEDKLQFLRRLLLA